MHTVILVARHSSDELRALLEGSLGSQASVAVYESLTSLFPDVLDLDPVLALLEGRSLEESDLGAIAALKSAFPALRVVLTFGRGQRDLAALAMRSGVDVYLLEPYYIDEFANLLQKEFHGALHRNRRVLDQKMDALASFVEGLAPEVNNPLTTIRGFLQILMTGETGGMSEEEFSEIYGLMDRETQRIATIVQELENFSRTRKPKRLPVNIPALIEQAVEEARAETSSEVPVAVNLDGCPDEGMLDRNQILSALKSLLQFLLAGDGEKDGRIELSAARGDDPGFLTIHLEGTGTASVGQEAHKVFIPLHARKIVRFKEELGLASAYGIIRGHGGRITAAPRKGGTDFRVEIPCGS